MKILIAEDDAVLSDGITRFLRRGSHTVNLVEDGAAAVDALANGDVDLLILDYGLPKIQGAEVLKLVRKRRPSLPVLLISAYDDAEVRVSQIGLSVDAFLPKPFGLAALTLLIRQFEDSHVEHGPGSGPGDPAVRNLGASAGLEAKAT